MPLLNDKLLVLLCKVLRLRQLANLQTVRLPELDARFHGEHGFARSMSDVDVDRSMLVAVEKESVAVLLEDPWHCKRLLSPSLQRGQAFENLPNVKDQASAERRVPAFAVRRLRVEVPKMQSPNLDP
jgi:hypothetical protein